MEKSGWAARGKGGQAAAGLRGGARLGGPPREKRGEKGFGVFYFPFCSNSSPKCTFHKFTRPQTKVDA
jgi:hypothetical protein